MSTPLTEIDKDSAHRSRIAFGILAVTFGISLNLAVTAPVASGARVGVSDFVAPLFGAVMLLWGGRTSWRDYIPPTPVLLAAAAMTVIIAGGAVHGLIRIGEPFLWGLVNRGFGWLVLLGYAGIGILLAHRTESDQRLFLATFALGCAAIAAAAVLAHVAANSLWPSYNQEAYGWEHVAADIARADTGPLFDFAASQYFRLEGLYQNPNAFGLLTVVASIVLCADGRRLLLRGWAPALMATLFTATYLSGSRSAWIGLAAGLGAILYFNGLPWRRLVAAGLAAVLVVVAIPYCVSTASDTLNSSLPGTRPTPSETIFHISKLSFQHRWELVRSGLEMWLSHPVFGAGIGSFYHHQLASGTKYPSTLHSTGLWLLTETGIVGLLTATGALLVVLREFVSRLRRAASVPYLALVGTAIAICFVAASIGFDDMYQRPLWLFLGLGIGSLGAPADRHIPADPLSRSRTE